VTKCRNCGKSGWLFRADPFGVCKECGGAIRADVDARLARLKQALLHIRCTHDPESLLGLCDAALGNALGLLRYEERRLFDITPRPSDLVAMLRAKREDVVMEQSDRCRPETHEVPEMALARSPQRRLARSDAPGLGNERGSGHGGQAFEGRVHVEDGPNGERDWWAWGGPDDEGSDSDPQQPAGKSGEDRKAVREPVHCYVLLEPGGIRATLENLSRGGLFLRSARLRPPGSRVRLILSTAQGPLQAKGVVRWVRKEPGRDDSSESTGMGIEFTRCSPELRSYLNERFPTHVGWVTRGAGEPQPAAV
jgi:hypothetical protein